MQRWAEALGHERSALAQLMGFIFRVFLGFGVLVSVEVQGFGDVRLWAWV